ncbi:MAG TPA: radical SAM protein [Deltaproteobacteria bacterium]|nr:radical SAM protein [Deltaproteobacteria bacterium]
MEKSYLHNPGALKIDLMLRGIRIDPSIAAEIEAAANSLGLDLLLPRGTLVNVPFREEFTGASPYLLTSGGRGFRIVDHSGEVDVEVVRPPEFYGRSTSTGVPFSRIATAHGRYAVITPSPRCEFFNRSVECRYCAGNFDIDGGDDRVYTVDEVVETVEAILKERASEIIYLSIGFSSGDDGGIEFLRPYITAVKKHFHCLVAVEALPPRDNRWIDETYAAGADSVLYNLEIFDKELFEMICPGRAQLIGRERYIEALRYAAGIFPSGTVASHLIVGLEMPGSTCQGIDFLTGMGVVPILPIYRPSPERALRIEPLTAEIIVPIYRHLYEAVKRNNISMNWVRDISVVTTPMEGALLAGEKSGFKDIFGGFYKTRLGMKAAWGLSTLRRKLRVRDEAGEEAGGAATEKD